MKLYKIIFLFWIYNIFAIFQFSWMAGSWFDTEDLMQRMDYEIYKPPLWQYVFVGNVSNVLLKNKT